MIRIARLTDYGIVLLTHMAARPDRVHNATELAGDVGLPAPTVSKLLRLLTREGLLESHRGAKGGYGLAKATDQISVAAIIRALEGPIALTTCNTDVAGGCEHEPVCPARGPWHRINQAVREALEGVRLSDMAAPHALPIAVRAADTASHFDTPVQAAGLPRG
jgi:FeS assembly SUF system regulator